jgi:Ferredoxin-like domain in Api92-like protein
MPNWCNNVVKISGDIKILKKLEKCQFDFDTIYPMPTDLDIVAGRIGAEDSNEHKALIKKENANLKKYGYKNWYDWCNAEWGTKWPASEVETTWLSNKSTKDMGTVCFTYMTAWGPGLGILSKLKENYPDLNIISQYYEPGIGFAGLWENNEDTCYDIGNFGPKHEFWNSKDGKILDEEFGIVESMLEYESQQTEAAQ